MSGPQDTRISAIIGVRDGERYLGEAIESILAQTMPVAELIVVDDGSTDGSGDLADGFGGPVVCVRRPARGLGAALNTGLERASGELIVFLDSDDLWTPRRLELMAAALERDPEAQMVFGAVEQFHSPERSESQRVLVGNRPGVGRGRLRSAMMARAPVFDLVGPYDDSFAIGTDVDWLARADESGVARVTIDEVVLRRRLHGSNMTGDRSRHVDYVRVVAAARSRRSRRPAGPK